MIESGPDSTSMTGGVAVTGNTRAIGKPERRHGGASLYEEAARLCGGVILDPRCLPLDPLAIGGPQWTQPGGEVAGVRLRKHLHAQDETSQSVRMLDEPSLGLAPLVVKEIFEIAAEINRVGTTLLLVEQNTGRPRDASGF